MSIELIDKIKPKNGGKFPLVDADDVLLPDGKRLNEVDLSKGRDGLTPYIGSNGNWLIGETDTGVKAQGAKGDTGEQGEPGSPGKDGQPGADGKNGADGYTPVKGVDYYTEADKAEIKAYIDSLFVPVTQEEYDALVPDPDKYYMIVG